jgi:hypothetical protein
MEKDFENEKNRTSRKIGIAAEGRRGFRIYFGSADLLKVSWS